MEFLSWYHNLSIWKLNTCAKSRSSMPNQSNCLAYYLLTEYLFTENKAFSFKPGSCYVHFNNSITMNYVWIYTTFRHSVTARQFKKLVIRHLLTFCVFKYIRKVYCPSFISKMFAVLVVQSTMDYTERRLSAIDVCRLCSTNDSVSL